MSKCNYSQHYGNDSYFQCDEDVYKDQKCKFHLKTYLNDNTKDEIISLFKKKIKNRKNGSLKCVGYILPPLQDLIEKKTLDYEIYFDYAEFKLGELNFTKRTIDSISFSFAKFQHSVIFNYSVFKKPANFSSAKFNGSTSFTNTEFGYVNFSYTNFNVIKFDWAHFNDVDFTDCRFNDKSTFNNTKFNKVIFNYSKFKNESIFKDANFQCSAEFKSVTFEKHADFSNAIFDKKACVIFNCNLSNISFVNTNIKAIQFGNKISWELDYELINVSNKYRKNIDLKIYEERNLEKKNTLKISLSDIQNIYLDLRDNFDHAFRYEYSGKFFVREMEMKRIYQDKKIGNISVVSKKSFLRRWISITNAYRIFSQYGQSYKRPASFIVGVGFMSVLNACLFSVDPQHSLDITLIRSLYAIMPFILQPISPNDMSNDIINNFDYFARIITLPLYGMLFIALKRKFEKKIRQ